MFQITKDKLNEAVDQAFGSVKFGQPDFEFVQQLKYHNGVFSAFKTHHQVKELTAQLVGTDGNLKTFQQFKKDVKPIVGKYNNQWLQTEYNTAVARARTAHQFKKDEKTAHLYPNRRWLPSRSAEKREAHMPFYNKVWPINDPFWAIHYPGAIYNCKCGSQVTDEAVNTVNKKAIKKLKPIPGLDHNPYHSGKLFTDSHPYIAKASKKETILITQRANSLIRKSILKHVKRRFQGSFTRCHSLGVDVYYTTKGLEHSISQSHKFYHEKNFLMYRIDEVIKSAKNPISVADKKDNPMIKGYHYLEFRLKGELSYLVIREEEGGRFTLYSIVDKLKE